MSRAHSEELERIKQEYLNAKRGLSTLAQTLQNMQPSRQRYYSGFSNVRHQLLEAAVITANDAYALLLIAKAEGFLRNYLMSLNPPIRIGNEPKLSSLIDKSYKAFNCSNPRIPIKVVHKVEFHDLRIQRNNYAHGNSCSFPSVERVATTLGRFFDQLP